VANTGKLRSIGQVPVCFDWFKKLRLFSFVLNLKIDVVLKASRAVVNLNNPKGASFKENRLMTTARDALRTTSIFRFSTNENNLNFLNQSKHTGT
jgi:hypothetical protein